MKFSIIIPVYNIQGYISNCLDSILFQTFRDYEIVCINDGSTDDSKKILDQYKNRSEKIIIIDQENKGSGGARNTGIRQAKGEYIIFVDGDDYLADEFSLENINNGIRDGVEILYLSFLLKGNEDIRIIRNSKNCTKEYHLFKDQFFAVWNKCYKKDFITENDIWFPEKRYLEDLVPVIRSTLLAKNISYIKEITYVYRRGRPGSVTSSRNVNFRLMSDTVRNIAELIDLSSQMPKEYKQQWSAFFENYFNSQMPRILAIMKRLY